MYFVYLFLVQVPAHLELLVDYLYHDPRKAVMMTCLKSLYQLALRCPHLWPEILALRLISFVANVAVNSQLVLGGLRILEALASLPLSLAFLDACMNQVRLYAVDVVARRAKNRTK